MATINSNGTGGGNWNTTTTWAGGVVPGLGDDVIINTGDTVVLDVNTAQLNMVVINSGGTITQASYAYDIDVDSWCSLTLGGGSSPPVLNNTGVISTATTGYVLLGGGSMGTAITLTGCLLDVPVQVYSASYTLVVDATDTVCTATGLVFSNSADVTITNGDFVGLSDSSLTASTIVRLNGTILQTFGNIVTPGYLTIFGTDCTIAAGDLSNVNAEFTDSTLGQTTALAAATANTYSFTDCTTRVSIYASGTPSFTFIGGSAAGSTFNASSSDVTISVTDCDLSSVSLQGTPATYYAKLDVQAELPAAYWIGFTIYGACQLSGYIRADLVTVSSGGNIWGDGTSQNWFTVKLSMTLGNDTFNGGTWYVYGTLQYGSMAGNTGTAFNLMTKAARIIVDSYATFSYGGLAGPPSPAYRGVF